MCLASMWYLTLVDFDWYPHWTHCHLPPPKDVINSSIPSNKISISLSISYYFVAKFRIVFHGMLEGKGTSLCFLVIWTLREILVLNNSWQYWHEYLSEEVICLASMWYLTFVDFDWKPHWTHCHLPPPSAVIISFNPCNNIHIYWAFLCFLLMWTLQEFLVLKCAPHIWQW